MKTYVSLEGTRLKISEGLSKELTGDERRAALLVEMLIFLYVKKRNSSLSAIF